MQAIEIEKQLKVELPELKAPEEPIFVKTETTTPVNEHINMQDLFLAAKLLELSRFANMTTSTPLMVRTDSVSTFATDSDIDEKANFDASTPVRKRAYEKPGYVVPGLSPRKIKRKRTCIKDGCTNYAIRNQVCWSHGANINGKRCKIDNCTKHAQTGGVCISHGAKRKRYLCTYEDCQKHAVQGRLCVGHGAKLVRCASVGCRKQKMVSGGYCAECLAKNP